MQMKHTVQLGSNRYIQLDSYSWSGRYQRMNKLMVAALALIIAAFTVPALIGIDITSPTPQNHADTHRTHR